MGLEVLPVADAILWGVQRPEAPLQIAGLAFFEGAPLHDAEGRLRLQDLRTRVASSLVATPRFRRRLRSLAWGLAVAWVDDEDFDVDHHVRATTLPAPGGEAELRQAVARIVGRPLDRSRPLWSITLIDGLADGRVALVIMASHVLLDGMALLDLAFRLLDPAPHAAPPPAAERWRPTPEPGPLPLAAAAAGARLGQLADASLELLRLAADPRIAAATTGLVAGAIGAVPRALLRREPGPSRPPLTGRSVRRRGVAWARLPLGDVRTVARRSGTTVNDVVLAMAAGAVEEYLRAHPELVPADEVRAVVPLSVHGGEAGDEVANRFGIVLARLPGRVDDPAAVLEGIHRQLSSLKDGVASSVGGRVFALAGFLPPWLVHVGGRAALDHQPFADLAVTNLRGPTEPYYLLGARMLEVHPLVTGTGNIATIVGVLSYAGGLGVCATVDADVVPDPEVLVAGFGRALDRLVEACAG